MLGVKSSLPLRNPLRNRRKRDKKQPNKTGESIQPQLVKEPENNYNSSPSSATVNSQTATTTPIKMNQIQGGDEERISAASTPEEVLFAKDNLAKMNGEIAGTAAGDAEIEDISVSLSEETADTALSHPRSSDGEAKIDDDIALFPESENTLKLNGGAGNEAQAISHNQGFLRDGFDSDDEASPKLHGYITASSVVEPDGEDVNLSKNLSSVLDRKSPKVFGAKKEWTDGKVLSDVLNDSDIAEQKEKSEVQEFDLNDTVNNENRKLKKRLSWYDQRKLGRGLNEPQRSISTLSISSVVSESNRSDVDLNVHLYDADKFVEVVNEPREHQLEMKRRFSGAEMSPDQTPLQDDSTPEEILELKGEAKEMQEFADDDYFTDLYKTGETDQEFYNRIFKEWQVQDDLANQPGSITSNLLWLPVLMVLRFANMVLRVVSLSFRVLPDFVLPLINSRFNFEHAKDNFLEANSKTFWAKFDVPLEQKKQAALVFCFMVLLPMITICLSLGFILLLFPLTTLPMLIYAFYIIKWDKSPENGTRIAFMRYWKMWRHFVKCFPIRLVKTYNLDPKEKYVFCYHPHGIISFGAFGNFATDATGFSRLFPGINLRLLTLSINFYVPWLREFLLSMGVCSCSRRSCNNLLRKRGEGSAIMLVVGGAEESLWAQPGTYRLNVNSRKGFVRVAIDNGAQLVPVLGFGENDVFSTHVYEQGSLMRQLQDDFKSKFGFATPVFWGRDIVNQGQAGVLPHRTPIIAVVGKPLKVPEVPQHLRGDKLRTTAEGRAIVNKYHRKYLLALKALYDAYKNKWAINRCESLLLVDRKSVS